MVIYLNFELLKVCFLIHSDFDSNPRMIKICIDNSVIQSCNEINTE